MKMKPLAFAIALGGGALAAYATVSVAGSSGTMMPIPTINPVNVDTTSDRTLIDQARRAADTLEYNQVGRLQTDFTVDGVKAPTLVGVVDSTGQLVSTPNPTITDPCKINPNLDACRSPEKVCREMGGTWSNGECSIPSASEVSWPRNANIRISGSTIRTDSTGSTLYLSYNWWGGVKNEVVDLRNRRSYNWISTNGFTVTPEIIYVKGSETDYGGDGGVGYDYRSLDLFDWNGKYLTGISSNTRLYN